MGRRLARWLLALWTGSASLVAQEAGSPAEDGSGGPAPEVAAPAARDPVPVEPPVARVASDPPVRSVRSLAGTWGLALDPGNLGLEQGWLAELTAGRQPAAAPGPQLALPVPGPLEALPQTASYDGVAWHVTDLSVDAALAGRHHELRFGQVNYQVTGWLDGVEVGRHEGGYDAFGWDVTAAVRPGASQRLVLRVVDPGEHVVDGLTLATTPHAKESWYHNFGGLLGPVELVSRAEAEPRIRSLVVERDATGVPVLHARVDWIGPAPADGTLLVEAVECRLPHERGDRPAATAVEDGVRARGRTLASLRVPLPTSGGPVAFDLPLPELRAWSPDRPWLGALAVRREDGGLTHERRFGFTEVGFDADGFTLNGERRVLRGVLYQPHWPGTGGVTPSPDELADEVAAMKRLGFDFVRTHVRPAPAAFLDACDEQGLMVLAEPAIGWVDDDQGLAARLHHEVDWMVARDHHHPSIVMWCVLNELSGEAYRHGEELALALAQADPAARPVLEDSGGFFGGRYVPPGGDALAPMLDEHEYPPFPLPPEERERMATEAHPTGPTVVSEYGYGTLLDTVAAAEGYLERGLRSDERILFAGKAGAARRSRSSGDDWSFGAGWVDEAATVQGSAARAMTEALRSNPALDMLCYTQWQAVSAEPSAGLRDVWGAERPAARELSKALADLLVIVEPHARSVQAGEAVGVDVVVVNDTGAPVEGSVELLLWWPSAPRRHSGHDHLATMAPVQLLPPGVTRFSAPDVIPAATAGDTLLTALIWPPDTGQPSALDLRSLGNTAVAAGGARVPVLPPPSAPRLNDPIGADDPTAHWPVALHLPEGDERLADFAARQGFEVVDAPSDEAPWLTVTVLSEPTRLSQTLSLPERAAIWHHVWLGGAAVVMLPSPKQGAFGRLISGRRGLLRLPDVPVDVAVGSAVGHFMGRVFPVLRRSPTAGDAGSRAPDVRLAFSTTSEGDPQLRAPAVGFVGRSGLGAEPEVGLLAGGDAVLSPHAMLVGDMPEGTRPAMLALGHLGQRLGLPVAMVPFGQGAISFVGLPLDEPVDGAADALRDAWLRHLVLESAAESRERVVHGIGRDGAWLQPRSVQLGDLEWATLEAGLERVAQALALADRASTLEGRVAGSEELERALGWLHNAWEALATGRRGVAVTELTRCVEALWSDELAAFLALEERVLDGVLRITERGTRDDWDRAFRAVQAWARGVRHWTDGEVETSYAWLGRAELTTRDEDR